ncbi:hypothetical protein H0H92_004672 [Tricholoma furcatifolium]|nr:hypothetical protein H0H92_004672 [Tricholoma furcatifolium]
MLCQHLSLYLRIFDKSSPSPLGTQTANEPPVRQQSSRKRHASGHQSSSAQPPSKRIHRPAVYGIGPSSSDSNKENDTPEHPALTQSRWRYGSLIKDRAASRSTSIATNVWYNVFPHASKEEPVSLPDVETQYCTKRFLSDGVIDNEVQLQNFDLLRFWSENRWKYPLLYRVELDVLPVQASSVPCERVFSSSKETDSLRRSQLSPLMMEMLQILKFSFREERLDFSNRWITLEEEMVDPLSVHIFTSNPTDLQPSDENFM